MIDIHNTANLNMFTENDVKMLLTVRNAAMNNKLKIV